MIYKLFIQINIVQDLNQCRWLNWKKKDKQTEPQKQAAQDKKIEVPDGPDAVARRDFMRTKLMYSQNILEGLTTGNFRLINNGIKELQLVTEGEKWVEVDDVRYSKLTEDFKTSVERLAKASESKNIDATAMRYYQMSTSCIDCHKHIRKVGYRF